MKRFQNWREMAQHDWESVGVRLGNSGCWTKVTGVQ